MSGRPGRYAPSTRQTWSEIAFALCFHPDYGGDHLNASSTRTGDLPVRTLVSL